MVRPAANIYREEKIDQEILHDFVSVLFFSQSPAVIAQIDSRVDHVFAKIEKIHVVSFSISETTSFRQNTI